MDQSNNEYEKIDDHVKNGKENTQTSMTYNLD